jgi:acyl carrier protein
MAGPSVNEIQKTLITQVANILSIDPATLTVDSPFHSLGMNSLAFVELLVVIEKAFNLTLIETDLNKDDFQTIRSLASRISRMM